MGETLAAFISLTNQFVEDMETIYNEYQEEKEDIGETLKEDALKQAFADLKDTRSEHFDEMKQLAKTYLENLTKLRDGDVPEQNESL
jgi:hypothetical protein